MCYALNFSRSPYRSTMKVRVRIFGDLAAATAGRKHFVELAEGATVQALIKILQRKSGQTRKAYLGEFKVGGPDLAIIVNGRNIALLDGMHTVLSDEDDVVIMPFISGG